jgi:hypothetical protein
VEGSGSPGGRAKGGQARGGHDDVIYQMTVCGVVGTAVGLWDSTIGGDDCTPISVPVAPPVGVTGAGHHSASSKGCVLVFCSVRAPNGEVLLDTHGE